MRVLIAATLITLGCSDDASMRGETSTVKPVKPVKTEDRLEDKTEDSDKSTSSGDQGQDEQLVLDNASTSDAVSDTSSDSSDSQTTTTVAAAQTEPGQTQAQQNTTQPAQTTQPVTTTVTQPPVVAVVDDRTKPFSADALQTGACSLSGVASLPAPTPNSVHFQSFSGAVGGNPMSIAMNGEARYESRSSTTPLDLTQMVDGNTSHVVYAKTFAIPAGKSFHVTKIHYRACVGYDNNGDGPFEVQIKGEVIKSVDSSRDNGAVIVGPTTIASGAILNPGDEASVVMSISNSSMAEVLIEGELK